MDVTRILAYSFLCHVASEGETRIAELALAAALDFIAPGDRHVVNDPTTSTR